MRFDFNQYATVYTDHTSIYDVYFLIIDKEEKTIECNDMHGFSIALIHYDEIEECGYFEYYDTELLKGYDEIIVKNGELKI